MRSLTKKQSNLGKDVGGIIASQLVPEIIKEKLAVAARYMPYMSREILEHQINASIQHAIETSPRLQGKEFTMPANVENALGEWDAE